MNRYKIERERRRREAQGALVAVNEAPDPLMWIEDEVTIEDPHEADTTSGTIIPFKLWEKQKEYLMLLHLKRQTVSLKARQLGISWVTIVYCLWLCIFHRGATVLVLSKDKDAAEEIIRRARGVFDRLKNPPTQKVKGKDNKHSILFANGSRFKAFAATKNAATSFTGTFIILDEADKMELGKELYTSVRPTIADGGRIAIIFTAFGEDGLGRALWEIASQELSPITKFFIPWWVRPGRTNEWYETEARGAISMAHHKQEYPSTPEEALGFTNLDNRLIRDIEQWNILGINPSIINSYLPCVLALDAGVASDLFVAVTACWHPTRPIPVIRDIQTWEPKRVEGGKIDLHETQNWITNFVKSRKIKRIVYDPWQLIAFGQELQKIADAQEFPQGQKRTAADTSFRNRIVQAHLGHLGQEQLALHISNANIEVGTKDDKKLRIVKRSKDKKIDLTIAASMAVWELTTEFAFNMSNQAPSSSKPYKPHNPVQARSKVFQGLPSLIYKQVRKKYE